MIYKGFKFGMLLQIAVGPIFLFIFQTAVSSGFTMAFIGGIGVALADAIYITAAILGIGTLLGRHPNFRKTFEFIGNVILVFFGITIILEISGITLIQSFTFTTTQSAGNIFFKVMLLTLSSPITILFWVGVFANRLADQQLNRKDMTLYGIGAILSTLVFITFVSTLGTFTGNMLPQIVLNLMNLIVGIVLAGLGIKGIVKK
jgi:threonine/homoserine/homoserine lactone efflux protein